MQTYGLWTVFTLIFLESAGVPLPGETALITASVYAGSTGGFELYQVIAVATSAAILGDSLGYFVGRKLGLPLLQRLGKRYAWAGKRVMVGEYLFLQHGGKIVFFGRFVALLRILAAVLAGANRMPWRRFVVMNAAGGLCWATLFSTVAYGLGGIMSEAEGPIGYIFLAVSILLLIGAFILFRRYEHRFIDQAMQATAHEREGGTATLPGAAIPAEQT